MTADTVDIIESSLDLLAQWNEYILYGLVDRFHVEFRVFEKIE